MKNHYYYPHWDIIILSLTEITFLGNITQRSRSLKPTAHFRIVCVSTPWHLKSLLDLSLYLDSSSFDLPFMNKTKVGTDELTQTSILPCAKCNSPICLSTRTIAENCWSRVPTWKNWINLFFRNRKSCLFNDTTGHWNSMSLGKWTLEMRNRGKTCHQYRNNQIPLPW